MFSYGLANLRTHEDAQLFAQAVDPSTFLIAPSRQLAGGRGRALPQAETISRDIGVAQQPLSRICNLSSLSCHACVVPASSIVSKALVPILCHRNSVLKLDEAMFRM